MTIGCFRCGKWLYDSTGGGAALFPWFRQTYSRLHVSSWLLVLTDVSAPCSQNVQYSTVHHHNTTVFFSLTLHCRSIFDVTLLYRIEEMPRLNVLCVLFLHPCLCFLGKITIPHHDPFSIINTKRWLSCGWLMRHTLLHDSLIKLINTSPLDLYS